MNIFLTLDYEIFFGEPTGSTKKCITEPTQRLMDITERTGVPMTYFIDIGYLIQLEKFKGQFRRLNVDFELFKNQVQRLSEQGNDCQLHIHPHWEDSYYDGKRWNIDISRYKLRDFESSLLHGLFERYKKRLERITSQPVQSYRAGGWCLQPFKEVRKAFEANGILLDSTVFPGGYRTDEVYHYDFRDTPDKTHYNFYKKLTEEDSDGPFLEYPIAAHTYHPLFFWQLFGWGRLIPSRHKPLGDGKPISTGGEKRQYLTKKNRLPVSLDGYFAKKLPEALKAQQQKGIGDDFVVIGHPKACTEYSLEKLEEFIVNHKDEHNFMTFNQVLNGVAKG